MTLEDEDLIGISITFRTKCFAFSLPAASGLSKSRIEFALLLSLSAQRISRLYKAKIRKKELKTVWFAPANSPSNPLLAIALTSFLALSKE